MSVFSPSPVACSNLAVIPSARFLQMTPFDLGEDVTPLVPLGQCEIEVSVLAT